MIGDIIAVILDVTAVAVAVPAALYARRARRRTESRAQELHAAEQALSEPYSVLDRVTVDATGDQAFVTGFDAYMASRPGWAKLPEQDLLLAPSPTPSNGQPVLAPHQLRPGWLPVRWVDAGRGVVGYQWECATCSAVGNLTVAMLRTPPWRWHRHFTRERLEGDTQ